MAQPLLDFITGRARLALPYLRAAAKQGLSAAKAIDLLRPFNLTFNRQRMLDVYGVLLNRIDPSRVERLVGSATPFPVDLHTPAPTNINSNFQYVVSTLDLTSQEDEYLTVSSSVPLAADEIREMGALLFANGQYFENEQAPVRAGEVAIIEANVGQNVP